MATTIQIKRSLGAGATATPSSLAAGELAFTSNGNILYVGNTASLMAIGGERTPGTLTANQALVCNSTSYMDVIRTANLFIGAVSVNVINTVANSTVIGAASNSELTSTWAIKTYVDAKVSGAAGAPGGSNTQVQFNDSGSFQGSAAFVFNTSGNTLTLANSLISAIVNTASLLMGNSTVNVAANSTTLLIRDATISSNLSTGALFIGANASVNTTAFGIGNSTVNSVMTALGLTTTGDIQCEDMTVTGNLVVSGTVTTIDATNIQTVDPLIKLAKNNNATDTIDIGFYGLYDTSGSQDLFTGFFRDASDGKYKLFETLQAEPTTTVNIGGTGYAVATLVAALESSSATITGGSITGITDLAVADGGTGASSFTAGGIIYGNGSSALSVTAAPTEGQILVANSINRFAPASALDGGSF